MIGTKLTLLAAVAGLATPAFALNVTVTSLNSSATSADFGGSNFVQGPNNASDLFGIIPANTTQLQNTTGFVILNTPASFNVVFSSDSFFGQGAVSTEGLLELSFSVAQPSTYSITGNLHEMLTSLVSVQTAFTPLFRITGALTTSTSAILFTEDDFGPGLQGTVFDLDGNPEYPALGGWTAGSPNGILLPGDYNLQFLVQAGFEQNFFALAPFAIDSEASLIITPIEDTPDAGGTMPMLGAAAIGFSMLNLRRKK